MTQHRNELDDLVELGELIATDGLDGHEASVRAVARAGRTLAPVAAAILGDPREPSVARLRAFAVVTSALRLRQGQTGVEAAA